ncbi:MAG TPA: STAS domain-containing protein [Mycobacteriales bacterium]|nr:STAS domain-containing protein [Mycobacteriales bacterium]
MTDTDPIVITPSGEIDLASAPALRESITEALAESASTVLVVDLADVTFMDSSGLTCLAFAHQKMQERDGRVEVHNANSSVRKLITVVGMDQVVEVRE